ncbi:MAG: class I SAM-dependent methyltransferase [Patescibacteria group bacterium]
MNLNKISKHWGKQFKRMRADNHYWLNNEIINQHVQVLMTGEKRHWLEWLLNSYFKNKKFKSSLSICCGDGDHEKVLSSSGKIDFVHGVDISSAALEIANNKFKTEKTNESSYLFEVMDVNKINPECFSRKYDLVFSIGSLHHIESLENVIETIKEVLDKDAYFIIVEYIGPKKFQWEDGQLEVINNILKVLSFKYKKNFAPSVLERPTLEEMDRIDPSEAVRSNEIYEMLKNNFDVEYERMFNGTIIHRLFPFLNLKKSKQQYLELIINMAIALESDLILNKKLKSDFVFMILKNKI